MAGGLATGLQGHLWSTSIGSGINVYLVSAYSVFTLWTHISPEISAKFKFM